MPTYLQKLSESLTTPLSLRSVLGHSLSSSLRPAVLPGALLLLSVGVAPTLAAEQSASTPSVASLEDRRHFAQRTGFGLTPEQLASLPQASLPEDRLALIEAALTNTIDPTPLRPPEWTFNPPMMSLRGTVKTKSPEERKAHRVLARQRTDELRHWWLRNMLVTENPLAARMTLFWQNHFTSSVTKVRYPSLMFRQQELIETHALGNFGDLLRGVLHDPAMLAYLDNQRNVKGSPNENLARELLELFTLGEGHYSERDIRETARALTGYSVDRANLYRYNANKHDDGFKTILGNTQRHTIDTLVDVLLEQEQTALFISEKLWREFVSPQVDKDAVRWLADIMVREDYELTPVLRALFSSDAFWAPEHRGQLVKSPALFISMTLRAFDLQHIDQQASLRAMRAMGQILYDPPNVKGWPGGKLWINASTLLARNAFVTALLNESDILTAATDAPPVATDQTMNVMDSMSDNAMSNNAMSDTAMSDNAMSDTAMSDTAMSDNAMSDNAMSDSSMGGNASNTTTRAPLQYARMGAHLSLETIRASLLPASLPTPLTDPTLSRSGQIKQLFLEPAWHLY